MLDTKFIFENRPLVEQAIKNKNDKKADIEAICQLYNKRRGVQIKLDSERQKINELSDQVAKLKREGKDASEIVNATKTIKSDIQQLEEEIRTIEKELDEKLAWVPNIAATDVPVGIDNTFNHVIKTHGTKARFDFPPKPHYEIAEKLDIVDFKRSGKLSGSHFLLFKKTGALLERALINFMLDIHTKTHGYTEIWPPYLVTRDCMFGTGQLPKLEQDMYLAKDDDLFLIPTAEVPLTNMFRGEILNFSDIPCYITGYTACFRREAGTHGQETRGMKRVHQFDKVELVKFVHPEKSFEELEKLLADAEDILQKLGLYYRVVLLSTGDMSFASAKTYDIEVWAPGLNEWLEVSSCSNFTDFQARRANIRFRDTDKKVKYVHTLNGSGLALPRTVIAILENYQQKDGFVVVPEALRPYLNGIQLLS